jgi:hypothetical protein
VKILITIISFIYGRFLEWGGLEVLLVGDLSEYWLILFARLLFIICIHCCRGSIDMTRCLFHLGVLFQVGVSVHVAWIHSHMVRELHWSHLVLH